MEKSKIKILTNVKYEGGFGIFELVGIANVCFLTDG